MCSTMPLLTGTCSWPSPACVWNTANREWVHHTLGVIPQGHDTISRFHSALPNFSTRHNSHTAGVGMHNLLMIYCIMSSGHEADWCTRTWNSVIFLKKQSFGTNRSEYLHTQTLPVTYVITPSGLGNDWCFKWACNNVCLFKNESLDFPGLIVPIKINSSTRKFRSNPLMQHP